MKTTKTPTPEEIHIERALLPRLKFMGYIFFGFGLCSFCFSLFADFLDDPHTDNTSPALSLDRSIPPAFFLDDSPDELELTVREVLNFYAIGSIFIALSASCFLFAKRQKKHLHTLSLSQTHHK